ncbi:hypothetical protein HCH_02321 [Hahella chejuensis KCTC 2396]|uniref:Uncharacterized protein n=1 Tax=Hahella chejuensis (strain KCTC 2396) TaxID=349521 RepID=Q2SJN0_HAHCH|nr:hypothetical protein HCH_02321 [Hahella chejuensis KCTC 2396]
MRASLLELVCEMQCIVAYGVEMNEKGKRDRGKDVTLRLLTGPGPVVADK